MSTTIEHDEDDLEGTHSRCPPPARVRPPAMTSDVAIAKFIQIRDMITAKKAAHKLELAPFNVALATLEAWLLDDLNAAKLQSMNAKDVGTAYKSTRTSATVQNWTDVLNFVVANNAWELLEQRVSKTVVEAIMVETQTAVPGVAVVRETVLNVRRS